MESDLTRVVRALVQRMKADVHPNTLLSVSPEYDEAPESGLSVVPLATLPSVVLSGPTLRQSRTLRTHDGPVLEVDGVATRLGPVATFDLGFSVTVAAGRTHELLELMATMSTFLHQARWLVVARDPEHPDAGNVRYEIDADGEFRTQLRGPDEVRVFTCALVVRGFDVHEIVIETAAVLHALSVELEEAQDG